MTTRLSPEAAGFEQAIKSFNSRLRLEWWYWKAKGDGATDLVLSPQWPAPFGPPVIRAYAHDGHVVIRPWDERHRKAFVGALAHLDEWRGSLRADALTHGVFLRVPEDRLSTGRYVVIEDIQGFPKPVYQLSAIDAGPVTLGQNVIDVVHSSMGKIEDWMRANEAKNKEAELEVIPQGDGVEAGYMPVVRTPEQQAWRADAEAELEDIARAEYHYLYSSYQYDPAPKVEGEARGSGFRVIDRRTNPVSGLLGP